jgi:hypothetical protein
LGSTSDILETSPRQQSSKEKIASPEESIKRRSHHNHHSEHTSPATQSVIDNNGSDYAFVMSAMLSEIKKLQQSVSDLSDICRRQEKKNDDLNVQLEKLNKAHYDLRREQTDTLSDVLEKTCK